MFKSGEGALEMAATSKYGSRRENYPMLIQRGSDEIYRSSIRKSTSKMVWNVFIVES